LRSKHEKTKWTFDLFAGIIGLFKSLYTRFCMNDLTPVTSAPVNVHAGSPAGLGSLKNKPSGPATESLVQVDGSSLPMQPVVVEALDSQTQTSIDRIRELTLELGNMPEVRPEAVAFAKTYLEATDLPSAKEKDELVSRLLDTQSPSAF
jgi:hypothetical protein